MSNTTSQPSTYSVCGIPIAVLSPADAAQLIVSRAMERQSVEAHLCNAYTLSLVDSDARLQSALQRAHLNLPDGTPVAWLGRRHGATRPVRGPGLVGDVAKLGVEAGLKHYLYGGAPGVAEAMAAQLRAHVPEITFAGMQSPPYHDLTTDELDEVAARIRTSGAHIVWIGLGTPRQDYLVPELARTVSAAVVPVGAAFDFWAGRVREAPQILQGSGLEWLYRLYREPRRLWRRYLLGNPQFLLSVARHRMHGRWARRP